METIKAVNYDNKAFDTGINVDDVIGINVRVISGDEILTIYTKDGVYIFDSAEMANNFRLMGFEDGSYNVDMSKVRIWNSVIDSYDRFDYAED